MVHAPVDELDAAATLAALEQGVRAQRAAEVEDLLLVAHWADLHSSDPRLDPRPVPGLPRPPGGDRPVRVAGEAPSRVIAIAEAKIIEADQGAHDQRRRTEQQRQAERHRPRAARG